MGNFLKILNVVREVKDAERNNDIKIKLLKKSAKVTKLLQLFIILQPFLIIFLFMFLIMGMTSMGEFNEVEGSGGGPSASGSFWVDAYASFFLAFNGSGNEELWWPIGSSEVTSTVDVKGQSVEFRSGTPVYTTLTSGYQTDGRADHNAIDLAADGDVYLIAMGDGVITYISKNRDSGYNNVPDANLNCSSHDGLIQIHIKYNNGYKSKYLHVKESSIPKYLDVGSKVSQGQVVAMMGNTGCSTGQHLHFELSVNGNVVNPYNYVSESNPRPISSGSITSEELMKKSISEGILGKEDFVEGDNNQQTVCLNLKNYYSDNVVAGLMVNIERESGFNPKVEVMDTNNKMSGGLFQWNAGRLTGLKSRHGEDWELISNQIEYFRYEVSTTEKRTASILSDTSLAVSEVAYKFCKTFERAANCEPRKSESTASKYRTYVANGCN